MKRFPSLFRRFDAWLCDPVDATTLALVRIVLACAVLLTWAPKLPHVTMLFSRSGPVTPRVLPDTPALFAALLTPPSPVLAQALFFFFLLCVVCVLVGVFFRLSATLVFFFLLYYFFLSSWLYPSVTLIVTLFLFACLPVTRADATLSLTAFIKTGTFLPRVLVSPLLLRLIAVQISAMYLTSGLLKVVVNDWQDGDALFFSLIGPAATPLAFMIARLELPSLFYDAVVFCVKAFEVTMSVGLWFLKTRWIFFGLGLAFHLLNALLFGFWSFLLFVALYVVFLPPDASGEFLRRLIKKRLRVRG